MSNTPEHARANLFRKTLILQIKLVVDGIRDAILIPVSLGAALLGLIRGGSDMDHELNIVLDYGRQSERWINLFGNHPPTGSLDTLLQQVESVITEQYKKGRSVEEAKAAVKAAMDAAEGKPAPAGAEGNAADGTAENRP